MQYLHRKSFLMQEIYIEYECKLLVNRFYTKNLKMMLITTTIFCWNFNGLYVRIRPIPSESSVSHATPCLVSLLDPTQYGTVKKNLSLHTPLKDQWTWTHSSTQSLTSAIQARGQHNAPASLLSGNIASIVHRWETRWASASLDTDKRKMTCPYCQLNHIS
jgi:hypothetical protein